MFQTSDEFDHIHKYYTCVHMLKIVSIATLQIYLPDLSLFNFCSIFSEFLEDLLNTFYLYDKNRK